MSGESSQQLMPHYRM